MAKTEENKRVGRKIIESAKRGLTLGATRANTAGKAYFKTGATMGELLRAYGEAMAPIHQAEYTALTGEQLYPPKLQPAKWNNATQNYEAIDPNQPTISKAPASYRAGTYEPKVGAQPIISAENVGEFAYDPLNWISGGTTKAAATGAKLIGRGAKAGAKAAARNAAPMIDRILTEKYGFPSLQPGIVKNPGGEWIQLEPHLARYDEMGRPGAYVPDVNKKFQKLLRNYIVNDMGTAQDPIRMSIDRGISHIDVPWATYSMAENDPTRLGMKLPSGRLGATEAGRNWEILSDNTISVMPAHIYRDTPSPYLKDRYPWLKNKPDNTPVFSIQDSPTSFEQHLGFDHILDVLQQKYLNDELTAEQLRNLSMEKAVRITHDANRAAAAAAGEAELKGYAPNLKLPKIKEYPSGHYIAELPDPTSSDEAMAIVNKIGCQGGWCTQHEHAARNYGSGRSKLHTLFDSEGRPHIQFQVDENIPGMLTEEEKAAVQQRLQDFGITGTLQEEREMYKHLFPEKIQRSIEQIKPTENSWSGARSREYLSRNPNYRNELEPIIQDFVQSNKWASVRDLDNAGLIGRAESGMRPALEYRSVAQELGVTPEDINDFILSRPESTSPYFSKKEFQDFMKLQDTPPEGMAQGGVIHMGKGGIAKEAIELAKKYLTPHEIAHKTAQKNAALPISKGGLGLPANNTAADRAKALGYDTDAYHGTPYQDFSEFKTSEVGKNFGIDKKGFFFTSSPHKASMYSSYDEIGMPIQDSGHILPVKLNMNYPYTQNIKGDQNALISNWDKNSEYYLDLLNNEGYGGALFKGDNGNKTMVVLDPSQIRSRFAAFDPMRKNENDILAGVGVGLPVSSVLAKQEQPLKKANGGVVHMGKGGIAKEAIELAKKYLTPLSEKEFYKTYIAQHKDIRNITPEDRAAAAQAILESGFNKGVNVNALPVDRGGPATDIIMKRYGNKAGDRVYLLPKEGVLEGGNGLITAEGYKPDPMQMLDISVDREPSYEAYLRNFTKKYANGGVVHMDEGGLNVSATGDYKTSDSENMSGTKYNFSTDIDILNKYGFGVTKQGEIIKLPERSYTFDDGYTVTQPKHKIKRDNITELRARYATDDGIEYGVARQPMSKGWSGYRRNIKDNSSVGVDVSPYYTGVNYTKNFAEGGEVHPEFNFEQINQYAEGGEVAHNDFNYAEIDALAQGFAKGGPVLSVGRGEKLPVSQGAGLTAKGRAKYNSATGGNLKAPAPHPKSEKDANRRKSFCARMSGMPGPMKDENGNPTRKAASLKRWNC